MKIISRPPVADILAQLLLIQSRFMKKISFILFV
ncbi:Hypothetical protein Minf_0740 [Methylacidiphilum infernorum V4]|uniref:Uncharacterized protein n=1 Tax=Methylacidiphilum infernorum (isolate V4) TaxID=481448 RepID=B3E0P1_METI4|nr:Hypothetical protein Minf_0740 [Methylacidiphilum infernorum V4]